MRLTASQLRPYQTDGYTVGRDLITPAEAARVRGRLLELLAGQHDWPLDHFQALDPSRYRNPQGGAVPIGVQQPAKREPVFRDVADHPHLQSVMTQLLGGPVQRFTDQALIKNQAIDGQSFYHQDSYYWHLQPERGGNAWIALDDVGPGAIAYQLRDP